MIVLVNPPPAKLIEEYDTPPYGHIGLAYLAAALRARGLPVAIADAKLGRMNVDNTLDYVASKSPRLIGITAFTHEINLVASLSADLKRRLPNATIVLGGVHASSLPEDTLQRLPSVDYIIKGEGERALTTLAEKHIAGKTDEIRHIPGLAYRDGGEVIVVPPAPWREDLDAIAFPAWDLFPWPMRVFPVVTSRGCPFKCVFCARMMGDRVRARSPENVIAELQLIAEKLGARELYFYDETFGFYEDWLDSFLTLMVQTGLSKKLRWGITTRANLLTYDVAAKMKEAGCWKIDFGVESGDDRVLKLIKKGEHKEDFVRARSILKSAGITSHSYFILGHPTETKESARRTIDFAVKLNTDVISLGIMIPYPGTEVARLAAAGEGGYKKLSSDWSSYNKQLGSALELESITRSQLTRMQLMGYLSFYVKNFKIVPLFRALTRYWRLILAILVKWFRSS
jgi:radical SAM superfamily enzyme YgiQ (UPF0313 family)